MRRTLDPKLDVVFKLLFAHPECRGSLISLLTAVLHPRAAITDVELINPEVPKREALERGVVLDLHLRLADGAEIEIGRAHV